jgi:hypothetical protein
VREYRRKPEPAEIDRADLLGYIKTFIPRFDCYSVQNSDGHYTAIKQQLTIEQVERHLRGNLTIGAYALNAHHQAKWICLDADEEQEWDGLCSIAQQFAELDMMTYLEPSRRGGHLWMFIEPLPGKDVRRFAKHLLTLYHLEGTEVYPKQDELRTGAGSLVRLPLGFHRKLNPPHRFTFKTVSGDALAPTVRQQIALLAQPKHIPTEFIYETIADIPEPQQVFPTRRLKPGDVISGEPSERIKAAISVRDFVSQYIDLDRNGRGLCPFHDDHRQSFSVSEDGNFWHCFAECDGQTVIDFYIKWQGVDFKQAIADLAKQYLPSLL